MGRTCRICGKSRPNERFGGRGLRAVICSKCRRRPKAEQQRILATEEVHGFLSQSNISKKNIKRLEQLASIEDTEFQRLRTFVLQIATVLPRKRRRWKLLRLQYPNLFRSGVGSNWNGDRLDDPDIWRSDIDEEGNVNLDSINLLLLECALDNEEP